jgi:hypothetical protein
MRPPSETGETEDELHRAKKCARPVSEKISGRRFQTRPKFVPAVRTVTGTVRHRGMGTPLMGTIL